MKFSINLLLSVLIIITLAIMIAYINCGATGIPVMDGPSNSAKQFDTLKPGIEYTVLIEFPPNGLVLIEYFSEKYNTTMKGFIRR